MGRRGKRPLPTLLKLAKGERRPSRVNYEEPDLEAPKDLDPPADLKGVGRAMWVREVGDLTAKGLLRTADMPVYELRCRVWTLVVETRKQMESVGLPGSIATGLNSALRNWTQTFKQLSAELGLTPSSRGGVKGVEKPQAKDEKLQRYLRALPGGRA